MEDHRVVVYYQTQYDSSLASNSPYGHYVSVLPLIGVITHLILAAFHINSDPNLVTIALNDNSPDDPLFDQMWGEISQLKASGIKVTGLLGGAAPGSYSCLTPDNFDTYYPQLAHYIQKYELDGMDLDVEQSVAMSDIVHLMTQLKSDFGSDFIITFAPVASALLEEGNISGFDYIQLEQQNGYLISWYNAQFYSGFGTFFPDDQYINITKFGPGLDPSRLVASTLTNPEDGYGYIDPDSIVSSVQNLTILFGGSFGGVAGWEYFNSLPNDEEPWQWATLMFNAMANPNSIQSRITGRRYR